MNAVAPVIAQSPFAIRPLRIALLGYRSHPHVGGQGIYLHQLSKALLAAGHQVDVISGPPYPTLVPGVRLIRIPSLNLYDYPGHHWLALRPKHFAAWADLYEWWAMATGGFGEPYSFGRRVYQYLKRTAHQYDIIHDNQSLSYGALKLQQRGLPLVTTIHHPITRDRDLAIQAASTPRARAGAKRWYGFVQMQLAVARQLKHIITVSECSKNDIAEAFACDPNNLTVIPNGVDTQAFHPIHTTARKRFHLITTASSDQALKGFDVLLKAVHLAKQTLPDIQLTVIGKLNPKGDNQRLVNQLNLQNCVHFKSGISQEQLNEQYARAEVAICPSLYEGFGLPALEAMAAGVPVISSDGGALPEVVGNAGLMVPAGNVEALSSAILEMLQNGCLRATFTEKGLQRSHQDFCWAATAKAVTEYYECVLKNHHAHRKA